MSLKYADAKQPFGAISFYRSLSGTFLENNQLEPDIKVANDPKKMALGSDQQLEEAVKELLKK